MAAINFTFRKVKAGIKCTGKVTLTCRHTISDSAVARTEEGGKELVKRLLLTLTESHARECDR